MGRRILRFSIAVCSTCCGLVGMQEKVEELQNTELQNMLSTLTGYLGMQKRSSSKVMKI